MEQTESTDASRDDAPGEWRLHLAEPAADEPSRQLVTVAGCKIVAPMSVDHSFWRAVEQGDVARVEQLLDEGEAVDQIGGAYGSTALGWAAFAGDAALVKLCLARGAKPSMRAKKGSTPLHMATWNGDHLEVVELLLEGGADPHAANGAGLSPLAQARWFDKLDRETSAASVFEMEAWRAKWGQLPAGRAQIIARLEAAGGGSAKGEAEEDGVNHHDASAQAADDTAAGLAEP